MADNLHVIVNASVRVFGFRADLDLTLIGAPMSIRLSADKPIDLSVLWGQISDALQDIVGFGLPDLGAWSAIGGSSILVEPSLFIGPSGTDASKTSIYLSLDLVEPLNIGGSIDLGHGVTVSITPDFSIWSLYIGYDAAAGGLDLRARVTTPTTKPDGSGGPPKSQIVTYPFPVPAQTAGSGFKINYLGLGQRVGPTVQVTANDPMEAIFEQLKTDLKGDDPRSVLTKLARDFYQPDRDWFIAAEIEFKGFLIRVLFNDPVMYGLEIQVAANAPSPFAGLLFEILYQKLSPNLGLYYGALTLPTLMRRIPLNGFILILPGFSIWVYTNGDFRINVGWPLGDNSIGISFDILIGRAGFYFAKLRSGDNPGAQANVDYNPILAFGMGVSLSAGYAFNASIFSASIAINFTATFQGLLAWRAGKQIYAPPDHYWFAATASLSVLIQGSVDFAIIRASVTISFTANVGVAFETDHATLILVAAEVDVSVAVKVVFFTIHLSFRTSVSSQFTIGSGPPASINGPLAPGLAIVGGFGTLSAAQGLALDLADRMIARRPAARLRASATPLRAASLARGALPGEPLRGDRFAAIDPGLPTDQAAPIKLSFLLQPTATYTPDGTFAVIASLVTDCPGPPGSAPAASPGTTSFELLVRAMVEWLLGYSSGPKLSDQFASLAALLGNGAQPPFGDWALFESRLRAFLASECVFTVTGVEANANGADQAAAVLPMFDVLRLTAPDGTIVDFDSFTPAPANYPLALQYYFQQLAGISGGAAPAPRALHAGDGSPSERSMASFLFLDYFLMQARNAANALWRSALDYEKTHQGALLDAVDLPMAEVDGQLRVADLVSAYVDRVTGDQELADLLDAFDYASAAGIGSRFLLGGLQLPIPADVPPDPTPDNMAQVPTAPLFTLTGQQWAALENSTATATLSINPDTTLPPLSILFEGSPANSATAGFDFQAVPPMPAPGWGASPSTPGALDVAWLPPITPQPAYLALKNQIGWDTPAGAATLLPLPEPLQTLMTARGGITLAISADPPPQGNDAASPPPPLLPASALLQIRLSLSQVPASNAGSVASGGSPVAGSPSANAKVSQYLPHVYQLGGTDEATRDLIHAALMGDLSNAHISLLYPWRAPSSPGGHGASPAGATTIMRSDVLGADVLLAKTNLSTLNQVPETGRMFAAQALLSDPAATDLAPATDPAGFLRLIWELSVVNAPGYFLFYLAEDGSDLPASIFASAGANGGQTVELDVVVELAPPAAPAVLPAYANAVGLPNATTGDALYAGLLDPGSGRPIQSYSPSYPAGTLAFSVHWDQPDDTRPVPVDALYHMLQYSVVPGGAYEGSVWSLPIGPTQNALPASLVRAGAEALAQYVQSVPAAAFLSQPSGTTNRYGIIAQPITAALRIVDLYGDPLPGEHSIAETPLYQDPLVALGEWPGLFVDYRVLAAAGASAQLEISLYFDPDSIVPPSGSPSSGIAPAKARTAWLSTLDRYSLIVDQMTDPNVAIAIASSLSGSAIGTAADAALIVQTAQQIVAAITTALDTCVSPDEPVVTPVLTPIPITIPFAAIVALNEMVVPLSVSIGFSRPPDLVDPAAKMTLPAVTSVAYDVHPDLGTAGASPGSSGSVTAFAERFEQAFQDFDGAGGCLKLAQRAGVSTAPATGSAPALWFTRWSQSHGVSVTLGQDLAFFALAPLSTKPMTRVTNGQTYSGVDLDAWARSFLVAFDAFLSPEFAVAIGVLDLRQGTSLFEQLSRTKTDLAGAIKLGLTPLFADQGAAGDLAGAQDRYQQAMLTALASAFTVTTIVQIPATVTVAGSTAPESPGVAPRLFGNIGSPDASPSTGRSSPYSLSGGNLDLSAGAGWMTTLLTVAQAESQAELALPLEYQVSYLQHDFEPGDAYLGYIPSSWLKFAIPDAAPLQMSIASEAILPIPLIFQPAAPMLSLQSATAAPLVSPSGQGTAEQEIAAAMRWIYSAELQLNLASQDTLYFDVTYNGASKSPEQGPRNGGDDDRRAPLFDALASFQAWYAENNGAFATIPEAAFPPSGAAPIVASPATAGQLIEGFQSQAFAVAQAWQEFHEWGMVLRANGPVETIDHFYLDAQGSTHGSPSMTITLFGRNDQGGPPAVWPTLTTADGQVWTPSGTPVLEGSPDGWYALSHLFDRVPQLNTLTLQFGPLDIMARQSGTLAAWIVRNADLVDGRETASDFVYRTQQASFSTSIIPLIHRATLPPVTPGPNLAETLREILTPIEQVDGRLAPIVRLSATYGYAIFAPQGDDPPLMTQTAILLIKGVPVTSPGALSQSVANALASWFSAEPRSTLAATLTLAITIFGTESDMSLPLVQFDEIVIPTGALAETWWWEGIE
jgi:hypothetical protein